jgi:DNA-binding transcriptional LysR family regulator
MRERSLTAAANTLAVSQPAVSKILKHMESQLGYKLFERIGGRLSPTAEAHLLFEDADRVFREMEVLREFARKIGERKLGLLRLGVSLPVAFSVLPTALEGFRTKHPGVKIQLHTLPQREITEQLAIGDIDLGLTMSTIEGPTIRTEILKTERIVAVMRSDDDLAAAREVCAADLAGRALISYGSDAEVGPHLDEAFAAIGSKRDVAIEVTSAIAAAPLVQAGLGVALVGGLVPWSCFEGLVARPFTPSVLMNLTISRNSARPSSRFFKTFLQSLRDALDETRT